MFAELVTVTWMVPVVPVARVMLSADCVCVHPAGKLFDIVNVAELVQAALFILVIDTVYVNDCPVAPNADVGVMVIVGVITLQTGAPFFNPTVACVALSDKTVIDIPKTGS